MKNKIKRKTLTLKEALMWVVLAGVAGHVSLWLINNSADVFYEASVYKLTGKTVSEIK